MTINNHWETIILLLNRIKSINNFNVHNFEYSLTSNEISIDKLNDFKKHSLTSNAKLLNEVLINFDEATIPENLHNAMMFYKEIQVQQSSSNENKIVPFNWFLF